MRSGMRFGLSSIEKRDVWSRWKAGQTLHEIGRAHGKPHDSIRATPERLEELYGTDKPTRKMVAENMDFFEDVDRGHAIYCVLFRDGNPSELFFAGMSYD